MSTEDVPPWDDRRTVMHCGDPYEDDLEESEEDGDTRVTLAVEEGSSQP
jgi:hypothetical protein